MGLLALALIGAGCSTSQQTNNTTGSNPLPIATTGDKNAAYTMQEVATANNQEKCWIVVNGNVYDVTSFIGKHPGGPQRILPLCGQDGTNAFEAQHGGQGRPQEMLSQFYIGKLQA